MQEKIETALVKLEIRRRRRRYRTTAKIFLTIAVALTFFVIAYLNTNYPFLAFVDVMIVLFGTVFIVFSWVPTLIQPLEPEYYAFKNVADAIRVLEKLKEDIGYNEAYWSVRVAYNALDGLSLNESFAWYKTTNETFRKFLKNLELIVLPAVKGANIKLEHLEEIALAIYSLDPAELDTVNKTLEAESSYKKSTAKLNEGIVSRVRKFLSSHNTLRGILVGCLFAVGCAVFYYTVVNYLGIPNGYALTASVAAFIGLLAIYARGRPTQKWSSA